MSDTVVVVDGDSDENVDASGDNPTHEEVVAETSAEVVDDVIDTVVDIAETVAETVAEDAAEEAVADAVEEIVEEATEVLVAAQFESLCRRIDALESDIANLRSAAEETPVVVVSDEAVMVDTETGVVDEIVDPVVTDTDSADVPPVVEEAEIDRTPNRKLGWRAVLLGGSGGTGGRRNKR